jgi:hypothetical protein
MNIYIGKIGKSVLFKRESWGPIGGDNEAPKFYENLFHRNPQHNYYLLGCNDFDRLSSSEKMRINKNGNVYNIWGKPFTEWRKNNPMDESLQSMWYLDDWVKKSDVKFDAGIVFGGPTGTTNIPGITTKMKTPDELANPLEMLCKYVAPLMYFMNEYKVPYMLILNDPRFFPPFARDWMHPPQFILSQYNDTLNMKIRAGYRDNTLRVHPVKCTYDAVETIFLLGEKDKTLAVGESNTLDSFFGEEPETSAPVGKDIPFMIVLNEGKPSRYELLKNAILNDVQDVEVYGKWDPRTIGDDPRFKGPMGYHELHAMLPRVKYTYCIPIKKGWVTAKFWEMAHHGIIPFLHPSYDEQNSLRAPEFLRVGDSKELFKRIKFLEENPIAYDTLVKTLHDMLKDEYYDGTYLNDLIVCKLDELLRPTHK